MIIMLLFGVLAMNLVDWWYLRCAFFKGRPFLSALVFAAMALLLMIPAWIRLFYERHAEPQWLIQASWIWLALAFWLFAALMAVQCWNWAIGALKCWRPQLESMGVPPKIMVCIAAGWTVFAALWGLLEASCIQVKCVEIPVNSARMPTDEYRIALLSDVHIGPACPEWRVRAIRDLVNASSSDLILSAGDFMDGHGERAERLSAILQDMNCSSGLKLGVPGNHDVYSDLDYSRKCHELAGFRMLQEETVDIDGWLQVHGEADPADKNRIRHLPEIKTDDVFRILLYHRPEWPQGNSDDYQLQCSGHSHGGQIFPFIFFVRRMYPFKESILHHRDNGCDLYVSMGTGLWGPPFRMLAAPEITLFILKKQR